MTFASGSQHGLRFIAESSWGVTPGTPQMIALRHTSCSLGLDKDIFQSQELRTDRMIADLRHGAKKAQGSIGFELSYGEYDPFLEAALFGDWAANVLKAGTTAKSFTIERAFEDIDRYGAFLGCMVDKLSLDVKPGGMVTGSFDIVGKSGSYSNTSLDSTPTASQTNSPFDGFTGTIEEGGSAIATLTGIQLSLANGLTPAMVLGSSTAASIVPGRSNLTGTVDAFFDDITLLNKWVNETESSIEFTLGSGAKSYTFLIPRVKFTGGDLNVQNENNVPLRLPFQALLDNVTGTNLQITRVPS